MTSQFTGNKGFEQPAAGDYVNAWAPVVNSNWSEIDLALGGTTQISVTGISAPTTTLTLTQYRPPNIEFTGALTANLNYQIPTGVGGMWSINNATTGAFTLSFAIAAGNALTLGAGRTLVISDGVTVALADPRLYSLIAAEISASVTPVNFIYPPLMVDRYGTNITPGTTVMTSAWQAAINVAKKNGGTITFGPGPYLIDAALDLTDPVGGQNCSFAIIGQGRFKASTTTTGISSTPTLILKHTGHAFDTTGSLGVHFENLSITTDITTYPKTCFLLARNTNAESRSDRLANCYVYGNFSQTILYNYGSEDDMYVGCQFYNTAPDSNTSVFDISASNIRGLTSTFTSIAIGTQSCLDHKIFGGEFANFFTGSGTTADVFRFDTARSIKIYGPWLDSQAKNGLSSGRALFYIDGTNGPTGPMLLSGVDGEVSVSNSQSYGILVSNDAQTHSNWVVLGCILPNLIAMLGGGAGATISQLTWFNNTNSSIGGGVNFGGTLSAAYADNTPGGFVAAILTNDNNLDPLSKVLSRFGEVDLTMYDTSQPVGSKGWQLRCGGGTFEIAAVTDTGTVIANMIAVARNGIVNLESKIYPGNDANSPQSVAGIYGGTGVPNNANGNNGDFYFRGDTPGIPNQRLYVRSAGTWVGIL